MRLAAIRTLSFRTSLNVGIMLNHKQILEAKFIRNEQTGAIVDMNPAMSSPVVVMTPTSVGNGYYNLLRSAAFLYQTVELHSKAIQTMIDVYEAAGQDSVVPGLLTLLQGLDIGKQIALNGVEDVAKRLNFKPL